MDVNRQGAILIMKVYPFSVCHIVNYLATKGYKLYPFIICRIVKLTNNYLTRKWGLVFTNIMLYVVVKSTR